MYTLLIIFFASFFAILIMVGRKLILLGNGEIPDIEKASVETSSLENAKHSTIKTLKRFTRTGLVLILRFYVRSTNALKNKYEEIKIKIINRNNTNNQNGNGREKTEVSKFLKMMSEYKHKIRTIKEEIKEEENS